MPRIKNKEALGLKAKKGKPAVGNKPGKAKLKKLYITESKSIREVAEILGCSKDMVYRSLEEYQIDRRPGYNRSKLRIYDLAYLKIEIKKKGYKEFALELGVDVSTLRKHIKKRISPQG
ncbi:hypothetical protein ACFLRX_04855 [Acidobacteriota bacterium]